MSDRMQLVGPMDRALFLKTIPLLSGLDPSELAVIAEYAQEKSVRKGEVFLSSDEQPQAFYVIVQGAVTVEGGEHPSPMSLGPEQAVGLLSVLAGAKDEVEAVAEVDTLLLEIDVDLLFDLFEENFHFLHHMFRTLSRLTLAERQMVPPGAFLGSESPSIHLTDPDRELDLVERLVAMRARGLFQRSGLDAMAGLLRTMKQVHFGKGHELWKIGDRSGFNYFILTGTALCTQKDGGRFWCGAGYPVGNVESMSGQPRWYDAVVETDLVALRGETERFLDVLEDDFNMAREFLEALATGVIRVRNENRQVAVGVASAGAGVEGSRS